MSGYKIARTSIEGQGIKPSKREEDVKLLLDTLLPVMEMFQKELDSLSCLFAYRMEEQQGECSNYGGVFVWDGIVTTTDIEGCEGIVTMYNGCKVVLSIGISVEALKEGVDYAVLTFLHELTHLKLFLAYGDEGSGHSEQFHNYLNMLLTIYNSKTGENVKNDYQGINPPPTH
jgi:hypothetical protein